MASAPPSVPNDFIIRTLYQEDPQPTISNALEIYSIVKSDTRRPYAVFILTFNNTDHNYQYMAKFNLATPSKIELLTVDFFASSCEKYPFSTTKVELFHKTLKSSLKEASQLVNFFCAYSRIDAPSWDAKKTDHMSHIRRTLGSKFVKVAASYNDQIERQVITKLSQAKDYTKDKKV